MPSNMFLKDFVAGPNQRLGRCVMPLSFKSLSGHLVSRIKFSERFQKCLDPKMIMGNMFCPKSSQSRSYITGGGFAVFHGSKNTFVA